MGSAAGEQYPPATARPESQPIAHAPWLADPVLAFAADTVDDLEKVRIAGENRLRQMIRGEDDIDKDGGVRGFGMMPPGVPGDEPDLVKRLLGAVQAELDRAAEAGKRPRCPEGWIPAVWKLSLITLSIRKAEDQAVRNLEQVIRDHPLGPWLGAQKGIGEKQGARLLAAIGDPYIRPEILRKDGTIEPPRPRRGPAELWALCGYHVIQTPVSGHTTFDTHGCRATDGSGIPADHMMAGPHSRSVGGEQNGHPGHSRNGIPGVLAGVAPKRARGQKANWSATAKMRAFLVAESCIKQSGTPYRTVYDATRAKYADAVHVTECVRCGPKGKPAQSGSPLSDGHKHARALRAVAKEVLKELWREAKRLHEGT